MSNGETSISKAEFQEIKNLVSDIREQKRKQSQREGVKRLTESSQNIARKITPKKPSPSQLDLSKLKNSNLKMRDGEISKPTREPINDSERMWVVSWWENRKKMDPNFDIDQWFRSSVHMEDKKRLKDVDNFWTGRAENDTTSFWTGSMWGI